MIFMSNQREPNWNEDSNLHYDLKLFYPEKA